MDGDGALPRNVAKKPSTSTGWAKTPKRLLSPNLTDNINAKKRKSLNLSSNSEIYHSVNNSSNILDIKATDKTSDHLESKNDKNETLDISSISENNQQHDCLADNNDIISNKNNKRVTKNTKYADFITNTKMRQIIDDVASTEHQKKMKSNKVKLHITADEMQTQNFNPLVTTCISPSEKRKKLSDLDETDSNNTDIPPRDSVLNNSLTQPNSEINDCASLVNSNNEQSLDSSSANEIINIRNSRLYSSTNNSGNTRTTRSRSRSLSSTKITKLEKKNNDTINNSIKLKNYSKEHFSNKNLQPSVVIKYDLVIEKLVSERVQTNSLDVTKTTEQNSLNCNNSDIQNDNIKLIDPNVYDTTLLEIKSEEDMYALESDDIITIDLEHIKVEKNSPCSSNSDLSELFSPIRDCHIHLERLYIESDVPKQVNVVNSFNKVIPICRCKGETNIQKKNRIDLLNCAQHIAGGSAQPDVINSAQPDVIDSTQENVKDSVQYKIIESDKMKTSAHNKTSESVHHKTKESAHHKTNESAHHKTKESSQHKTKTSAHYKTKEINVIEQKSEFIPTSSETDKIQDTNLVSVDVPEKIEVSNETIKKTEVISSINQPKYNKKRKPKKSPPVITPILNSHVVDVIEEVILSSMIESPEKEVSNLENHISTETVHPSKRKLKSPVKLKEKVSTKNEQSITPGKEELKIIEEPKANEEFKKATSVRKEKHLVPKTQSNNISKKIVKQTDKLNSERTTSTSTLLKMNPPESDLKNRNPSHKIQILHLSGQEIKTPTPQKLEQNINKTPQKLERNINKTSQKEVQVYCLPSGQEIKAQTPQKLEQNINKTPQKEVQVYSLPSGHKIKTPSPQKMEQNINKSPQRAQVLCLPRKLDTLFSSVENMKKSPQKLETSFESNQKLGNPEKTEKPKKLEKQENLDITIPELNKNLVPTNIKNIITKPGVVKLNTKFPDVQAPNLKNITTQLDESSTTKTNIDLRQILEKRNKEKSDLANKYKNIITQTSPKSNKDHLKNPLSTLNPEPNEPVSKPSTSKTLKISPNKSMLIQIKDSPINDNIKKLFESNELNNSSDNDSKTIRSPEIKITVSGRTLLRSNTDTLHTTLDSEISNIIASKLNKIFNDHQQNKITEVRKSYFKGSTENLFNENKIEPLQIIIDNDISQNESNKGIFVKNETNVENETNEQTKIQMQIPKNLPSNIQQDNADNFLFTKPKHTFKFIEKCDVKRPPTRKPGKIKLNRPKLDRTPSTSSISTSSSVSSRLSQSIFKAPIEKKRERKPNLKGFSNKDNVDYDVISILADTTGLESICDTASIKNIDSDYEDDLNDNETFMDKERFTQVKYWLSHSVDQSVTEIEPELETEPIVTPIKKSSEIPVARVNPGIQKPNSEGKSPSNESKSDERVNVKLIPEEKKAERPSELEMFKNICYGKFRHDVCHRKKCYFAHSLPNNWQSVLKSLPVDALMRVYKYVKDYNLLHFYKMMLSLVAEQLGAHKDFNNITNLVKDVLEMKMNTDREPLVKDIIQALIDNGFSFFSTVEIVFRSANVEPGLKNLLCDILLNLTVERRQLEDNWPIILMLSVYKKFDIDKGIIQFIIIEALAKNYLQKDLVLKINNDLFKKIPDFNMRTISATLCQKFVDLLRKYNLQSDADELFNRCVWLNILEKPSKKNEELRNVPVATNQNNITKVNPIRQDDTPKETKIFDFPPPLISNQYVQQKQQQQRPQNHSQYQPVQEQSNRAFINQVKQEQHYSNPSPSHPQQEHQQQEHAKRTLNQNQNQNLYQSEQKSSNQLQQEHQMQRNNSNYKKNPKNHPMMPGLRADKALIDHQNYTQFFRSTQPNKLYMTGNHEIKSYTSQPSTSSYVPPQQESSETIITATATITTATVTTTNQNQNEKKVVGDDFDRFLCYSTENLDLLANTATATASQNLLDILAADKIQSPVRVERQPFDDQSYAALAPNQTMHFASTVYNFSEVKQLVAEENYVAIMQLIVKHREGNTTDTFLSHLIEALISTSHNYPTFFSNLSDMSAISNDIRLNYMLKTIGVNLVLYLCQNNQYDPAFRVNNVLITKCKPNDLYDVYNCKIYLKNKYSYFRRILIIAEMYIIKNDILLSWNMLRDNALPCGSYWQNIHDEADLEYRDFVLAKLFESFKKIKNSKIALDVLLYLIKYNHSDIYIQEHANSILVNAINNRCNFDKIEEFMNVSPEWYKYLGKNTIRAILVTAYLERKACVTNLYEVAYKLRICPQLMGNEKIITLNGHYHYAELQLYLEKFFQNMVNFMPITDTIIINFSLNDELFNDEIPLLVHQYNSSITVLVSRVTNILENNMKPPIQVINRNNCLYLDPQSVNTHLLYRQQSSL